MKNEQETKSRSDITTLTIIIGIAGLIFVVTSNSIDSFWRATGIMLILLSFAVALVGKSRNIGFAGAFYISLFLSPIIGLIITLGSTRLKDEVYKEKMLEMAGNNAATTSVADQLYKLNELRREGVLTDEEFSVQKEKLLNI